MPTLTAVVISEVLLPQSNIMAAFVHSHSSLFSDVSPGLPTYNNQLSTYNSTFESLTVLPQGGDNIIQVNNKLWMSSFGRIKCEMQI